MSAQTISVLYQSESFSVDYSKLHNSSGKFREIISPYIESGVDIQNLQLRILYDKFNTRDVRNFLKMIQNQKNDVHSNEISEICKLAKLFQVKNLYDKSLNYCKNRIDPNFTILENFEENYGQKFLEIQYINGQNIQHSYSTNNIEINNTNAVLNTMSNMVNMSKSDENFTTNINYSNSNEYFNSNLSNSNENYNSNPNFSSSNENYNSNLSNSNEHFNSNLSSSNTNFNSNLSSSNEHFNSNLSNSNEHFNSNLSNSNEHFNSNLSNSNEHFNSNLNLSSSNQNLNSSSNFSNTVENISGENSSSSNKPFCVCYKIQIFNPLMKCCRYFFTLDGQFLFTGKKKSNEIYIGKGNDIHIHDENGSCARIMQCDGYNTIFTSEQEFNVTFVPMNGKKQFSLETSFILNGKTIFWSPKEIDATLNGQYNHAPIPSKKNMLLQNKAGSPTFIVRKMDNEVFEVECLSIVDPLIAFTIGLSQIIGPFLK